MKSSAKPTTPLFFRPLIKRALWGGRRLGEVLGKPLGPETDYAESWEIVDHGQDQSVVVGGPWTGRTLGELTAVEGSALLGRHAPQQRFPLLFKFLDCREKLSVQVHPNDAQAATLTPPDLGKTEAWVILAAEPGSVIYAGLKPGHDRAALQHATADGTSDRCLHRFEPQVGECLFLPAGVVHAPGGGLLIAEIQQASDTTFRLFDWNRTGADGKPRQLHIEQGLAVIDYDFGPARMQSPQPTGDAHVERLVACDKFVLDRITLAAGDEWTLTNDDRFRIFAVCDGAVTIATAGNAPTNFDKGATCLLPACVTMATLRAEQPTAVLMAYLP
ncbi:MAG: class I mannose-6-phosphate isomerase [Planctomycetaceae bacterium]|nr:class I mannose-6-phosphate isomerase [Planctomycetaceae bacterium]